MFQYIGIQTKKLNNKRQLTILSDTGFEAEWKLVSYLYTGNPKLAHTDTKPRMDERKN